jgi:MFS family permease
MSQPMTPKAREARLSIGFINWAHALDHYVMLIFPTVVIGLELVYGRSYAELIALGTASFVAFGIFSLPAGWLADRWSRRNMMVMFYAGCGVTLVGAGFAPNLVALAVALCALGVFAAIYHPVGTAMLIEQATARGRSLAFNGVCGNVGAALAAGVTAALAAGLGWRAAFLVPGVICLATALLYLRLVPNEERKVASRGTVADVPLGLWLAATIFGLFIIIALCAGLVFNIV